MRFLRRTLWLRFHLWTIGFLLFVSAFNLTTQLRSYDTSSSLAKNSPAVLLSENSEPAADRNPASTVLESVFPGSSIDSETNDNSGRARALKLASLGCEPNLKLALTKDVQQLRLKFENCPSETETLDDVVRVSNATNGFQATVFSFDAMAVAGVHTSQSTNSETEIPGVFVAADSKPSKVEKEKLSKRVRRPASDPVSTDYISLAEGINEIRIQRSSREQTLQIVRK